MIRNKHSPPGCTDVRTMDSQEDSYVVGHKQYTDVRLSLNDIAKRFASPLTEEHAWAILYQLTRKFARQIAGSGVDRGPEVLISLEGVSLSGDGEVFFKSIRKSRLLEGNDLLIYKITA